MKRVIYCPDESILGEAVELSKKYRVPIQIGDSERTINLEFDRTKTTPLIIPEFNRIIVSPKFPRKGSLVNIDVLNDFIGMAEDTNILVSTSDGSVSAPYFPSQFSAHSARFKVRFKEDGLYRLSVINKKTVISEISLEVKP